MNHRPYHRSMRVDIERAEDAVRIAAHMDWTWSINDLDRFSSETGWAMTRRSEFGGALATGFAVRRAEADFAIRGETIKSISFAVVDAGTDNGAAVGELVRDSFADLGGRMAAELGDPTSRRPGAEPQIRWDMADLVVILSSTDTKVLVRLVRPEYQREQDHVDEVVIPWRNANPLDGEQ